MMWILKNKKPKSIDVSYRYKYRYQYKYIDTNIHLYIKIIKNNILIFIVWIVAIQQLSNFNQIINY